MEKNSLECPRIYFFIYNVQGISRSSIVLEVLILKDVIILNVLGSFRMFKKVLACAIVSGPWFKKFNSKLKTQIYILNCKKTFDSEIMLGLTIQDQIQSVRIFFSFQFYSMAYYPKYLKKTKNLFAGIFI